MNIQAIKTRRFNEHENVLEFILEHITSVSENTIIVITSKIVALAQGLTSFDTSVKNKEKLIKSESKWAIKTKYAWLTYKDNMIMASAGIDESNAFGKLILLPRHTWSVAKKLRVDLQKYYKVKNIGVLITDSRTVPLRAGVVGAAVAYAGFKGIRDYRGKKDLAGRKFHFSRTNIADCLASAAVCEMGEGAECQPLAVITKASVQFTNKKVDPLETRIPLKDDMYLPFFKELDLLKS